MNEDWLAAWDAASEEDRRAVLETVAERVEPASTSGLPRIDGPHTFVIAARRDGDQLIAATCSHYRVVLEDATAGIPVIPTDYHFVHVEIDETVVEGGRVVRSDLLHAPDHIFHVEPDPGEVIDDAPEARGIAEQFLTTYPALSRVRAKTFAECEDRTLGSWLSKAPQIRMLAVVPDGDRHVATILATYVIWHSSQSEEWGVQYLTIDELAVERGAIVAETRKLDTTIDIAQSDLNTHDDEAATRRVLSKFLESADWRVAWQAGGAREQQAASHHAMTTARADYHDAWRPDLSSGWHEPVPEVLSARRTPKQLTATFGWTFWAAGVASESVQTFAIHEVTVEDVRVVRDRRLASATLTVTAPRDQHDPIKAYRDRLPGLRDLATAIAHIGAKLDAICEAAPGNMEYVQVAPTLHVVRHAREQGRLVARVLGWYRLGAQEQVGRDRITRYITVDDVTVENCVVSDTRSLTRTWGQMSEQDSETEVGERLDAEHVSSVMEWARTQP